MNERIQALVEQAMETVDISEKLGMPGTDLVFNKEKFAELIVRECSEVCKKQAFHYAEHNNQGSATGAAGVCSIRVKEHFGVAD